MCENIGNLFGRGLVGQLLDRGYPKLSKTVRIHIIHHLISNDFLVLVLGILYLLLKTSQISANLRNIFVYYKVLNIWPTCLSSST